MVSAILSRLVILVFGTLYPAYASYKAVRNKNVKEYVKWMMYWIVFALFCTVETFSDFFLSWFPFYYEFKIVFVLWMLSPITQGSSFLFKKFVHPQLARREKDIDEMIEQATKQGYSAFVDLGNKGIKVILKSVIMGQSKLADHLRRSYSTSDLSNDGHDIVQRQESVGDQDREDELDNRLIEDQEELERRSSSVTKSRSSSSALSLSSVKEEDVEDNEHATTETFTIPSNTKRHYSVKEDKTATRQLRCQSLPPFVDKYTKPLIIASTNLESKRQFFTKLQSVDKKEISSNTPPLQVSPKLDSKRHTLTRSLSQDSGTNSILNTIASFANKAGQKTGKTGVARTILDNKEITAEEKAISKSNSVIRTDSQSSLLKEVSLQLSNEADETKQDQSLGIDVRDYTDEEIRFMRRSLPRFVNELPAIDEAVPLELARQSVIQDSPESYGQYASYAQRGDPMLLQVSTDILGEDLSNLIFLNVEDDMDDQCSTPVAKDSPSNLSLDDEIKDTATEKESDSDSLRDSDSIYTDDDASSVCDFKSLDQTDNDYESFSEAGSSVNWDTLSEVSTSDLSECHDEDVEEASTLKDVSGSWSAPSSPASFMRGSKYEDSSLQSWRAPASLFMYQRSKGKDEPSWTKPIQRQSSLPSSASRNILHSWPSPSQFSDSATSSRTTPSYRTPPASRAADKVSAKSYGQSFDPFKTWYPPSRSGALASSYRSQSFDSPSAAYLQSKPLSLSERSHYTYARSASADLAGGEALYSRYSEGAYSTNPLSHRTHSRSRSGSLSTGRSSTSLPTSSVSRPSTSSRYPTKTSSYYTSKK